MGATRVKAEEGSLHCSWRGTISGKGWIKAGGSRVEDKKLWRIQARTRLRGRMALAKEEAKGSNWERTQRHPLRQGAERTLIYLSTTKGLS